MKGGGFKTFVVTFKPGWSHWSYRTRALDNYLRDLSISKPRKRKPVGVANVEELPIHSLMTSEEMIRIQDAFERQK